MSSNAPLVLLADVKAWLGITSATDDTLLTNVIAAASAYWLWRTGLSSLNSVTDYTERYDGTGATRLFLRNRPITAVRQVVVYGVTIPQSLDYIAHGWVIDQSAKSIAIVGGGYGVANPFRYSGGFCVGLQNVLVDYSAGYATTPDDVAEKVKIMVAVNYKRRNWADQKTQTLNGMQTVAYRDWELPPDVCAVMNAYTRRALA